MLLFSPFVSRCYNFNQHFYKLYHSVLLIELIEVSFTQICYRNNVKIYTCAKVFSLIFLKGRRNKLVTIKHIYVLLALVFWYLRKLVLKLTYGWAMKCCRKSSTTYPRSDRYTRKFNNQKSCLYLALFLEKIIDMANQAMMFHWQIYFGGWIF